MELEERSGLTREKERPLEEQRQKEKKRKKGEH